MTIDRDALLEALEQLGSTEDETALKAARAAAALVAGSELDWDEIVPEAIGTPPAPMPEIQLDSDDASVLRTIESMLKRPNLHDGTREDLEAFRDELKAGELEPEDRTYILKLYERVAASK